MARGRKQLSENNRSIIIKLDQRGLCNREIGELVGCSIQTVFNIKKLYNQTGSLRRKPGSERPPKTTAREDRCLINLSAAPCESCC